MRFAAHAPSPRTRRRRRVAREEGLPLTSLIDVVFLLLVYFIVTSRLTPTETQLPSALAADRQGGAARQVLQPQVLTVMADPAGGGRALYRVGERRFSAQESLATFLGQLPKDNGLFVRVDPGATTGMVAAAMQAARDAGFTKITYVPVTAGGGGGAVR